jgi:hypothetical protein
MQRRTSIIVVPGPCDIFLKIRPLQKGCLGGTEVSAVPRVREKYGNSTGILYESDV